MRRAIVLAAALLLPAVVASGAVTPSGRYSIEMQADGFIRLDTQTGNISHCSNRAGVWFCDIVSENRALLDQRLDALAAKVDAIAAEVAALKARPGAVAQPAIAPRPRRRWHRPFRQAHQGAGRGARGSR